MSGNGLSDRPVTSVRFEKMHGLGNDFMLVDTRHHRLFPDMAHIRQWADRHHGVGFDQLILLSPSRQAGYLAEYRFFNADGSSAEQCGNGQRCLGRYLWTSGWADTPVFRVTGPGGPVSIVVHAADDVEISLPEPRCRLAVSPGEHQRLEWAEVDVGNPHHVRWVDSVQQVNLAAVAREVRRGYPEGVNVEVVEVVSPSRLRIRIDERGCGETRACGSGAAAAAVATVKRSQLTEPQTVRVDMPGGALLVNYDPRQETLSLRGAATHVYQGRLFVPSERLDISGDKS